ncbi:hypothetical protein GCM10018966_021960 [Streptomyces yanii]
MYVHAFIFDGRRPGLEVVMERPGQVDAVALDRTGTLTEGTPRVTDIRVLAGCGLDEGALLMLAAAAEHPSGRVGPGRHSAASARCPRS